MRVDGGDAPLLWVGCEVVVAVAAGVTVLEVVKTPLLGT